jgi:hypothetical protein
MQKRRLNAECTACAGGPRNSAKLAHSFEIGNPHTVSSAQKTVEEAEDAWTSEPGTQESEGRQGSTL